MLEQNLSLELQQKFINLIAQYTGLKIRKVDGDILQQKLSLRNKELKFNSLEQYYQFLTLNHLDSQKEWKILVSLLTNLESYFFRDKGQFSLLEKVIFPQLISNNQTQKTIRICSAGCSTGEEPYSLAILAKKVIPDLENWNLTILGVDINQEALKKAKKGVYSSWSFRNVDPEIQQNYFQETREGYHLLEDIREMVQFENLNLVNSDFPNINLEMKNFDLILCRNVFIYFDQSAVQKVINKFYKILKKSGYLLTGHAEISGLNLDNFQSQIFPQSIIYQPQEKAKKSTKTQQKSNSQNFPNFKTKSLSYNSYSNNKKFRPSIKAFETSNNYHQNHKYLITSSTQKKDFLKEIKPQLIEEELIENAQQYIKQKSYNLAIEQLQILLDQWPKNFEGYYLMAQIYANTGKYQQAIEYSHQALEIDPLNVQVYYLLSQISEEEGNLENAKTFLKKIIYLKPNILFPYFELSNIYQQEQDFPRSLKMQKAALKTLKKFPPHTLIPERGNITAVELISELEKTLNQE